MADDFRMCMDAKCGVGGVKCSCCNNYKTDKPKLRRLVRSILKRKVKKQIKEETQHES